MAEMRVCEVHKRIDNDLTLRECVWCAMCKSWICKADLNRFDRRAKAALIKPASADVVDMTKPKVEPSTVKATPNKGCGGCGNK